MKFGVVTVSDTCYKGENIDYSGPAIIELIKAHYTNGFISECIVPDEIHKIKEKLINWSDNDYDVIFTTGGTGVAPRDVTFEATKAVIEKEIPGITYAMLSKSLQITPYAMLSRAVAGIRKKSLIINFPGSLKAVKEHFEIVHKIIPHTVALIKDEKIEVIKHHKHIQNSTIDDLAPSKVIVNRVAGRDRVSKYKMLEVEEALSVIIYYCGQSSDSETLNINDALGRVLSEDVRSLDDLPPFAASIKDGYAVKSSDGAGERTVCDVKAAGDNPNSVELQDGFCVRISTGASVPAGADAIVQVEDTDLILSTDDLSQELKIFIKVAPTPGKDIRPIGSDITAHSIVLTKGLVLNSPEIGVLAAVGRTTVKAFTRPRIGIISTGNEVQDSNEPLQPGRIRDSNKITLLHLLKQYSYTAEDCGIARDDPTSVKRSFKNAFDKCDFVITTGGVSMGEFDLIKEVLIQDFNANIHFGRINMKPGKPTTFATCLYNGNIKTIFGLPGNPVSATVTCFLFVIPALRFRENRIKFHHKVIEVYTDFGIDGDTERPDYQRVMFKYNNSKNYITTDDYCANVESTGNQISSKLNSFVGADGLMVVPPGNKKDGPFKCYLLKNY